MKSIKLTITYKNGNVLDQIVHYVHFRDDAVYFKVKKQLNFFPGDSVEPVRIPLANIETLDISGTDQLFN